MVEVENVHFQGAVEITFRNVPPSRPVEELVHSKLRRLKTHYPELHSCRVVVDSPHQRHRHGNHYHVTVDMIVPSKELSVSTDNHDPERSTNVQRAVREAFSKAERQLRDYQGKLRRHDPALNEQPTIGRVARIIPDQGKGYIESVDGQEFYFDEDSLLEGPFDEMEVGDPVSFAQPSDDRPAHASSVVRRQKRAMTPEGVEQSDE